MHMAAASTGTAATPTAKTAATIVIEVLPRQPRRPRSVQPPQRFIPHATAPNPHDRIACSATAQMRVTPAPLRSIEAIRDTARISIATTTA